MHSFHTKRLAAFALCGVAALSFPIVRADEPAKPAEPAKVETPKPEATPQPTAMPNAAPAEAPKLEIPMEEPPAKPDPDEMVNHLFDGSLNNKEFTEQIKSLRASGTPEQVLLEARLLRGLVTEDVKGLTALLPQLKQMQPKLDLKKSKLFQHKQELQGLITAIRALQARKQGDAVLFERYVKDAFWMTPKAATILADWAKYFQTQRRVIGTTFPLTMAVTASDGKAQTLKQVMGKKGLLLDFWASWCVPCMMTMSSLPERSQKLKAQGITLAGLNTESDPHRASAVKQQFKIDAPWLVEPKGLPISRLLEAESIPWLVLITPDGKVRFAGHRNDEKLPQALAKLGVKYAE